MLMTKAEAIEKAARAIAKRYGPEDGWRNQPRVMDTAESLVAALEALGLLKLSQ
jgi:hypothetical protein